MSNPLYNHFFVRQNDPPINFFDFEPSTPPPPPAMHTPSEHKSVLESADPRVDSKGASGCTWSTARATARLRDGTPGVVKQDKSSGGSVDTTKTCSGPRRVRMSSGERPIGAAKGKQSDTEVLCQPPPPPPVLGNHFGGGGGGQKFVLRGIRNLQNGRGTNQRTVGYPVWVSNLCSAA